MARSKPTRAVYAPLLELASGGMGRVELVVRREDKFERLFAMKRLRSELRGESEAHAMFLEEARLAGLIRHPNVVSVLDVGSDDGGPYLVMEYVESVSVAVLIAAARGSPLPTSLCLRIALDVARGLHAAHELTGPDGEPLRLVHRDVSPPNILVGFDGVARIADFGIARAEDRSHHTTTGWLKGKVRYMAPEQLRFEELDRRTDLFALGIVLFELLSGQKLYGESEAHEVARRILSEPPPDLAEHRDDVSPELVELLFELLAKSKEARPRTAREVAQRLERMILECCPSEGSISIDEYLERNLDTERRAMVGKIARARAELRAYERRRRSRPFMAFAGVAFGLAALSVAIYAAMPSPRAREPRSEEAASRALMSLPRPPVESSIDDAEASAMPPAPAPTTRSLSRGTLPAAVASTASARSLTPRARPGARRPRAPVDQASAATKTAGGIPLWERYE